MHVKNEKKNENPTSPASAEALPAGSTAALAMGCLLADLNHDIRTSMNGIVGMLNLLCDTELTSAQRQYARTAQDSADNLLALIERIVDLSLIGSNQFRLEEAPFDLQRELLDACSGKAEKAAAKGVQLTVVHPASAMTVEGDSIRLRELISSLIEIALNAAEQGDVSVEMKTAYEPARRCRFELCMRINKLSEIGRRLLGILNPSSEDDIAAARAYGIKALEPTLCAQLARQMGAHTIIEPVFPHGSIFRLSLSFPTAPHPVAGARGLLIAEDAADWQERLSPFSEQGIRIDATSSAVEGLAILRQALAAGDPFRVVLLGPRVQGMDATILATAIKGDAAGHAALLAFLGNRSDEDQAGLIKAGFSALISKTADAHTTLSILDQLWKAAAAGNAPAFLSSGSVAAASTSGSAKTLNPFPGQRVLVADDNPVNREVAARMLEKLGIECTLATDGREAVEMVRNGSYAMILMDCEMPQMDGFEATARIRATELPSAGTPIIALTASTAQGERERCLASGMNDFLAKPIRPQVLKEMLARWLPTVADVEQAPAMPACEDELEAVQEMFGADFSELVSLYRRDSPPRIETLHRAYADSDSALVAKVAHALGGSSASIGATGLAGLCKTVEMRAKAGALDEFEKNMTHIEAEYRRICSKLQSLIE